MHSRVAEAGIADSIANLTDNDLRRIMSPWFRLSENNPVESLIAGTYPGTKLELQGKFYSSNTVVQDGLNAILICLQRCPQIQILCLAGNNIGDDGAKALATNRTLTELYVNINNISSEGAIALAQSTTLVMLDISGNNIGLNGAKAFAKNATLRRLYVNDANLGDAGVKAIALNSCLALLSIKTNHMGYDGVIALANNTSFTSLYLQDHLIKDAGVEALAENKNLTDISLGIYKDRIKGNILTKLEGAVRQNRTNTVQMKTRFAMLFQLQRTIPRESAYEQFVSHIASTISDERSSGRDRRLHNVARRKHGEILKRSSTP